MFEAAGYDVLQADRFAFMQAGTRIERSIAARFHRGRSVHAFNRMLRAHARAGDYDVVFVEKGVWVWPSTLRRLKTAARQGLAVHYTPDAQFLENRSRHFRRGLPLYDLAVTTKPFEREAYRAAGARAVRLIHQGHGSRLHPVPMADIPAHLRSEVCFIGHCQPHYAALLRHLAERVPLKIWGPNWTAYAARNDWARGVVQGDACYGAEYACALSGAKIAIGLLSKRIPETTTTRSFEIPACGTLLLAERTEDHRALFEEGHEAEFFDSAEECAQKAADLLQNEGARSRMAAAGLARCRESGYSSAEQFGTIMDWLEARQERG
jgi:spore maturation protein CgeB